MAKKKQTDTRFDSEKAGNAVDYIQALKHTKGEWHGENFKLLPWQSKIITDIFGTIKSNGYRQYNTAYIEIPKKMGKSELAAAVAIYLLAGDGEWGAEVYGCAADRQQASIVFDVACQMIAQSPYLSREIKVVPSQKRLVYPKMNSFYQVLSAESYCMRPDTKLQRKDGAWIRADEVKPGDIVLGYGEKGLDFGKVNSVERQVGNDIYMIETHRGRTVEVTANHCFFVMIPGRRSQDLTHGYTWKRADEMKPGDRIKVALGNLNEKADAKQDLLEAWALGAWAGDGECGRFRFTSADDEIVRSMREFVESIGSRLISRFSTRQERGENRSDYPYEHSVAGCGKRRKCAAREWIRNTLGQESRAATKKVPDKIFKGSPRIWAAFLSGYLDTDGCIPTKCRIMTFSSASLELLKGCQELFSRLGINASLNRDKIGHAHTLTISGHKQLKIAYEKLSPFIRLTRKRNLLESKLGGGKINYRAQESDKVVSVERLSPNETISIEVDGIHTHVTNGLVSHNTKHGLNVHGVIFDELHAQPNRELFDVMTHGSGDARKQPLYFLITTAGTDRHSICWEVHQKAEDILRGKKHDPTFYPVIYGAKDEDDWTDEEVWKKANPSLGVTVDISKLRAACESAKDNPAEENLFRQLRLNQWVKQSIRWMPMDKWDKCNFPVDIGELYGRECYGGLDLSSSTDITAFVLVFPPRQRDAAPDAASPDLDGKYIILPYFWVPEETLSLRVRRDHVPYDIWEKEGSIKTTDGNVIHYDFIEKFIEELGQKFNIKEIAFDRWGATQMTQDLADLGFTVVPFGQGFASMSPPTKELMKLTLEERIAHGGNEPLRWMMDNIYIRTDPAGNIKVDKEKSTERIDGAVATIMALDRAIKRGGGEECVYDTRGLIVW
jgi:phage terminase large subunit-like protein